MHFRSFPSDTLLRWDGEITLRAAFFNSLKVSMLALMLVHGDKPWCSTTLIFGTQVGAQHKAPNQLDPVHVLPAHFGYYCVQEAAYICQGSARGVMDMALEAQNDLWSAVTAVSSSTAYCWQVPSFCHSLHGMPRLSANWRLSVCAGGCRAVCLHQQLS